MPADAVVKVVSVAVLVCPATWLSSVENWYELKPPVAVRVAVWPAQTVTEASVTTGLALIVTEPVAMAEQPVALVTVTE